MHPVIAKIGPVSIYSYGFMVAIAFTVATMLAALRARREKVPAGRIVDLSLYILISGVVGARLLYVLLNWKDFIRSPLEVFMLPHGGLVFYGGAIFALVVGIWYAKRAGLSVLKTSDMVVPYVALGQAIGRIGCLLNGCCYGKPTEFFLGLAFPGSSQPLHPAQVYSSLKMVAIFVILRIYSEKKLYAGQILILYGLLYSGFRFLVEFLRGDSPAILFGLTVFQLISAGIFLFCLVGHFVLKRKCPKSARLPAGQA